MIRPLLLAAVMLLTPPAARAHDWYPQECCSGNDCRPMDPIKERVETHADGYEVWFFFREATDPPGPLIFVHDFVPMQKARWSKDNQFHVCPYYFVQKDQQGTGAGKTYVRCFFRPPPST
jgi:hypothetical protein